MNKITQRENLDFGEMLSYLKRGFKAKRKGWNVKEQFIVFQKGYPNGIAINKNTSEALGLPEGTVVKFRPYIMIKANDGTCVAWVASQTDILSNDWIVFE